jgi:hypothetical protein
MIVTDLEYPIDKLKVKELNKLCDRVSGRHKHQNVIITEGKEGYGKSTITAGDAYYMAYTLRRRLTLFFNVDALIDYSKRTKDEIIIFDDAAIAGLSIEAYNKQIVTLIKVLMLGRKNRNTYFINIQDVTRMKSPLVERAIGMNRVYSPDGLSLGKFVWYNENQLRYLFDTWKTRKKRDYSHYQFRGNFSNVLYKIFNEEEYDKLKDDLILSIGEKNKESQKKIPRQLVIDQAKLKTLQYKIGLKGKETSYREISQMFDIPVSTLQKWFQTYENKFKNGKIEPNVEDGMDTPPVTSDKNRQTFYIRPIDESYLGLVKEKIEPILIVSQAMPPKFLFH